MRILIAGSYRQPFYEEAFANALRRLGHSVAEFDWSHFFNGPLGKLQAAVPAMGPATARMNIALTRFALASAPDIILIWRGTHVLPYTYGYLRSSTNAILVSYNNDDFNGYKYTDRSPWHHRYLWRLYKRSFRYVDTALVYRSINVQEALAEGATCSATLLPYFIPEKDRPVHLSADDMEIYGCDVVFVGHYEPDGRDIYLKKLVEAGFGVKIFGGDYWNRGVLDGYQSYFGRVRPALGLDYSKALCGANLPICFLSSLNRDTYTRRCFEIPAHGRLLLSQRSADLLEMFRENEEAVFFSTVDELIEKVAWLLKNPGHVDRIAAAGYKRVHSGGYSIEDRAKQFLELATCGRTRVRMPLHRAVG